MKLSIVIGKLLKFKEHVLLGLVGLCQVSLSLGFLLSLVDHLLGLCLDGRISLLDEILIRLLGILLRADGISLHGLGIVDDLLDHAHHATSSGVLLVLLEARRRRRASWLLLQKGSLLLLVEALENLEGSIQELLRCALVCNGLLELFVLLFTVLASSLHLDLRFLNLRLQAVNVCGKGLDGHFQIFNLGEKIGLLTFLLLSLKLIGVELLNAEILVLDLIFLLLEE